MPIKAFLFHCIENQLSNPQSHIAFKTGMIVFPKSDKVYSTFGGTTGYTVLTINPSVSNSLNC